MSLTKRFVFSGLVENGEVSQQQQYKKMSSFAKVLVSTVYVLSQHI
jgi:hypothetical protein